PTPGLRPLRVGLGGSGSHLGLRLDEMDELLALPEHERLVARDEDPPLQLGVDGAGQHLVLELGALLDDGLDVVAVAYTAGGRRAPWFDESSRGSPASTPRWCDSTR